MGPGTGEVLRERSSHSDVSGGCSQSKAAQEPKTQAAMRLHATLGSHSSLPVIFIGCTR